MTRYFFNVRSENTYISDAEGQEHADLGAAKEEAKIAAREMLAETVLPRCAAIFLNVLAVLFLVNRDGSA